MSNLKQVPHEETSPENLNDDTETGDENINTKRTWYRTVFFQATVIGLCAFFAPGLYNAMQSTGAGGQQTPYLVMSVSQPERCVEPLSNLTIGQLMLFWGS